MMENFMSKTVKKKIKKKGSAVVEALVFEDGSSENIITVTLDDGTEIITVTAYGPCTNPADPC